MKRGIKRKKVVKKGKVSKGPSSKQVTLKNETKEIKNGDKDESL